MTLVWGKPSDLSAGGRFPVSVLEFHPKDPEIIVLVGNAIGAVYRIKKVERKSPRQSGSTERPTERQTSLTERRRTGTDDAPHRLKVDSRFKGSIEVIELEESEPDEQTPRNMYVEQDPPEEAMLSADGALTGDKKKEDRLGEEDDRLEESEAIFFHGSPAEAPVACERLHIVKEHSGFLVNAHWSPDGALLATSDSGVLIVWLFDPLGLEICSRLYSVTATSEVFDFCWLDSAILVLGGITKIIFSHRGTTIFELDLPDGAFCKGLKAQRSDQNYSDHSDQSHSDQASDQRGYKSYLLCVATSTKQHLFYRVLLSEGFDDPHTALSLQTELLWEVEEKLFEGGDVPLLRSPSIDPTGQLVCLPYGERRRQFFAVCCDLRSRRNFRLRGHQARISCAALANTWHQFPIPPSAFIPLNEALVNVLDDDKITNDGQSFSFTLLVHYSTLACPLLHPCFSTPPCF